MRKELKSSFVVLLSLSMAACSWGNNPVQQNTQYNEVHLSESQETVYIAKVGEKGADIFFRINTDADTFSVKANEDGTPPKTAADINTYLIYLVKNSATGGYPSGGDPLGDAVAGPFTITNSGAASKTVQFSGVPPSGGDAYYVALKAQDSGSNNLIKDNNGSATAWTGTTAGDTLKIAVSTGSGVVVAADYTVSSTTPLSLIPQLLDAVGATIEADVTPSDGEPATNAGITGSEVLTTLPPG